MISWKLDKIYLGNNPPTNSETILNVDGNISMNWNTNIYFGSTDTGIRDNNGNIEFKNQTDTDWKGIGTGSGGGGGTAQTEKLYTSIIGWTLNEKKIFTYTIQLKINQIPIVDIYEKIGTDYVRKTINFTIIYKWNLEIQITNKTATSTNEFLIYIT